MKIQKLNLENWTAFRQTYLEELRKAVTEHPEEYAFGLDAVDLVWQKMLEAVLNGTFSKDGYAFKATCKKLKIKHTYKAIGQYLDEEYSE